MKFQFCGNLHCPEWFLAESSLLSKLTPIKLKQLTQLIINHILQDIDTASQIITILENQGFSQDEINSIVASLQFIFTNAISYDVDDNILNKELIDLGLPKENIEQITKNYKANKDKLRQKQAKSILRISQLKEINYGISKFIISNEKSIMEDEEVEDFGSKFADTQIKVNNFSNSSKGEHRFIVFPDKLNELIFELEKASQIMNKY